MSEIKTEIKPNPDGSYTITDAHSTADIVRWLLTQDTKPTILYLLGEEAHEHKWVGLNDDEMLMIYGQNHEGKKYSLGRAIEAKLRSKNT